MKVALAGVAGSGKNYLADRLTESYGWKQTSFAYPLKKLCTDLYQFMQLEPSHETKDKPIGEVCLNGKTFYVSKSHRDIWLETSATIRSTYDNIWIDRTMQLCNSVESIIITDLRTVNELNVCLNNGFVTIWIEPNGGIDESKLNNYDIDNTMFLRDSCDLFYNNQHDRDISAFFKIINLATLIQ